MKYSFAASHRHCGLRSRDGAQRGTARGQRLALRRRSDSWGSTSFAVLRSRVSFFSIAVVAKPEQASASGRLVSTWMTSRPSIFHEGGNLYDIDVGSNTVETGYPLE